MPALPVPFDLVVRPKRDPVAAAAARRAGKRRTEAARRNRFVRVEAMLEPHLADAARAVCQATGETMCGLLSKSLASVLTCSGQSTAVREHLEASGLVQVDEDARAGVDVQLGALLWQLKLDGASMRVRVERVTALLDASELVGEVFGDEAAVRRACRAALLAAGVVGDG